MPVVEVSTAQDAQSTAHDVGASSAEASRPAIVDEDEVSALRAIADVHRADGDDTALARTLLSTLERGRHLPREELDGIFAELIEMGERAEDFEGLVEVLTRKLDFARDVVERRAILRRIAALLVEEFDDAEQAFDVLSSALHDAPEDLELVRDIERLARWTGRFSDLVATASAWLSEEASTVDLARHVELLLHLARWYDVELGERSYARTCLEQAAELGRWDVRPRLALASLHRAEGRIDAACELLEDALSHATARADRLEVSIALGDLLDVERDDAGQAERHFRVALELAPNDPRALRGLARVLPRLDAWSPLVDVLEALLDVVERPEERSEVLLKLAEVREVHFLDAEGAAQRLEQLLELDPLNDAAFIAVARCYARLRLWDAAVHAHERHVEASLDDVARVQSYVTVARICVDELGVIERGIEAYQSALDLDPTHLGALEALSRLYERRGETTSALATQLQLAECTEDPRAKVELYHRLAVAHREKLGDQEMAKQLHRIALANDPTFVPSISALRRAADDAGAFEEVATLLDREQRHTPAPRARGKLLVELGNLRRDRLDDPRGAMHAYEEAHAIDPENEDAAWAVASACVERGEHARAEPILARLSRTAQKRERGKRNRIFGAFGQTLAARGKPGRALDAFKRALEAVPNDEASLRGLADAAWTLGDFPVARAAHQKLLMSLGDDDDGLRAQTLYRLGSVHKGLGEARKAIDFFERALELDGGHRPSLEALAEVHEARGSVRDSIEFKRRLAEGEDDPTRRCSMLCEIATAWTEREKEPRKAVEVLHEALLLKPDDRPLLHRLMQQQEAAEDFEGLCETIERVVSLDDDPRRRARYLHTAALVARDRLQDFPGAIALLERALDQDSGSDASFVALAELHERRCDYRALEASHRRMIGRIAGQGRDAKEFELWHALGCIYRDRLGQHRASAEAFRMASRLRPEDSQERRILAEVYQASDRIDLAIAELRSAIDRDPLDPIAHRALYTLYARCGMLERAYAVANVLVFLEVADADERGCFEELRPQGVPAFRATLDERAWRSLVHPSEDSILDEIFARILPAARAAKLKITYGRASVIPESALRQDPEAASLPVSKVFFGLARVLGVDPPELYVRKDVPGTIGVAPTAQRTSIVGASLLDGFSIPELAFIVGKHLAQHRREVAIKTVFSSMSELGALLVAAVAIGAPEQAASLDAETLVAARRLREEMSPIELEELRRAVARFVASGGKADVRKWMQAAELTTLRAGLVACGDLRVAAKIVKQEPVVPGDLPTSEKIKELVRFVVSDDYAEVRAALGIAGRGSAPMGSKIPDDDDEPTLDRKLCA